MQHPVHKNICAFCSIALSLHSYCIRTEILITSYIRHHLFCRVVHIFHSLCDCDVFWSLLRSFARLFRLWRQLSYNSFRHFISPISFYVLLWLNACFLWYSFFSLPLQEHFYFTICQTKLQFFSRLFCNWILLWQLTPKSKTHKYL